MKKLIFLSGIACGVVLSKHWKSLAKEGIKVGIQTGQRLNELSQMAKEEFEDATAEVVAESAGQNAEEAAAGRNGSSAKAEKGAAATVEVGTRAD